MADAAALLPLRASPEACRLIEQAQVERAKAQFTAHADFFEGNLAGLIDGARTLGTEKFGRLIRSMKAVDSNYAAGYRTGLANIEVIGR